MAAAGVAGAEERGEQAHQPEKQAKEQSYVLERSLWIDAITGIIVQGWGRSRRERLFELRA